MKLKGSEVKSARDRLGGITQGELAELLGTSQSTVSRWEAEPDVKIPWSFSQGIQNLLRRVKQGKPLYRTDGLPANVVELSYPEGRKGPRVWVEDTSQRERTRKEKSSAPERPPPPATPAAEEGPDVPAGLPVHRPPIGWMGMAASVLFMGCFVHADRPSARTPNLLSDQIYEDNAKAAREENESIPMPSEPYPGQKRAPCDHQELERVTGCWMLLDRARNPPPCPEYAVEDAGKCLVPVPAKPKPKRPSSTVPGRP